MKTIVKHAHSLHIQPCQNETEAELLEAQLIQKLRPRWNVAGAFYFLYPLIGLKVSEERFSICYSTQPDQFPEFEFHGAFRSRMLTRGAYESLTCLFDLIGHRCRPSKNQPLPRYSLIQTYRQIPDHWYGSLSAFLKGETRDFLEELTLQLLENAGARRRSKEVEQEIRTILAFWQHEAQSLFLARNLVPEFPYPVSQTNRDLLFIRARHRLSNLKENTNTDRSQYLR